MSTVKYVVIWTLGQIIVGIKTNISNIIGAKFLPSDTKRKQRIITDKISSLSLRYLDATP